jgi:hypothetical protein
MKKIIIALIVLFVAFEADARIYQFTSGEIKDIRWDAPTTGPVTGYEYYFLKIEDGRVYGRGEIAVNRIMVRFRTPGTFALWVRPYTIGYNGARTWGAWAQSTDPAFGQVSGQPGPWLIKVE